MLRPLATLLILAAYPLAAFAEHHGEGHGEEHHHHDAHAEGHHADGDHDHHGHDHHSHHEHGDGFVPLFDGESIDGWVKRGGDATYTVAPNAPGGAQVIGTCVYGTPNTFLCTPRDYADFVLEFEVKVHPLINSGVQFRSLMFDTETTWSTPDGKSGKIAGGRVHGYQCEIDPSDRAWSAGIYDEARRGWIFNLEGDEHADARAAFDRSGWNHYRIEAVGDSIKTFLNGVPATDLKDDVTSTGFIALQVHSIHNKDFIGKQIRWRNIQIKEIKPSKEIK